MNIQLNIKRKAFLPVYLPYVKDYKNRYEVYYGGAGSGKSVFIAQKLLIKACSSKRKILVIRKYLYVSSSNSLNLCLLKNMIVVEIISKNA